MTGVNKARLSKDNQMISERFVLEGQEMEDGRTYITSETLKGFRLMVQPDENVESAVLRALKVFYPLWSSQRAKEAAERRAPRVEVVRDHSPYFAMSAEYACAL